MDPVSIGIAIALIGAFVLFRLWIQLGARKAREQLKLGARLVDVRSAGEFASGHLAGALNIPLGDLPRRINELKPADKPIVVYCLSGTRSAMAASQLRAAGFRQVFNLGPMSNGQ